MGIAHRNAASRAPPTIPRALPPHSTAAATAYAPPPPGGAAAGPPTALAQFREGAPPPPGWRPPPAAAPPQQYGGQPQYGGAAPPQYGGAPPPPGPPRAYGGPPPPPAGPPPPAPPPPQFGRAPPPPTLGGGYGAAGPPAPLTTSTLPPPPPPFAGRAGAANGAPAPPPGQRIDPSQIPRPAAAPASGRVPFWTRADGRHADPPPSSVPFSVTDAGDATPRTMRPTLHTVPATADGLRAVGLPLTLFVTPLARPEPGDAPIPLVDAGPGGPPRCGGCRAYVAPGWGVRDSGATLVCNLCGASTPAPYDVAGRPEMTAGAVDYVAPPTFCARPPAPPATLFALDASFGAVSTGLTAAACACAADAVRTMPPGSRVGVAAFGSSLTFFAFSSTAGADPAMLVVADADAPFAPAGGAALFADVADRREDVLALLARLPSLFAASLDAACASGAALAAAAAAVSSIGGGAVVLVAGASPRAGALGVDGRGPPLPPRPPLFPAHASLADAAASTHTALHIVLAPAADDGGAGPLAALAAATGGEFAVVPRWTRASGPPRLAPFFEAALDPGRGWEAVGVLRLGEGLSVVRADGAPRRRAGGDVDLPAVSPTATLAYELAIESKLAGGEVGLQFALAHTTATGERRVRVLSLSLPVAPDPAPAFRGADGDALLAAAARAAARGAARATRADEAALTPLRDAARGWPVAALAAYRSKCAPNSPAGQLILPDALKLAPLSSLALAKHASLAPGTPPDARAAAVDALARCAPAALARALAPALLALHASPDAWAFADPPALPAPLSLSAEAIAADGVYALAGDGREPVLLHAGASARGPLADALPPAGGPLPPPAADAPPNEPLACLWRLVRAVAEARGGGGGAARAVALPRGAAGDASLAARLVEDRGAAGPSYVEHLCWVHRQVQKRLQ